MPPPIGKKFKDITTDDIEIIKDPTLTSEEVCRRVGIHFPSATLSRWRKKLGIILPKGCKPGVSKPWQVRNVERKCEMCDNIFVVKPASKKKTCSRECYKKFMSIKVDRSYTQTESFSKAHSKPNTPKYKRYAGKVHRLSQKTYIKYKHEINPNDYIRTLCGVENGYQLDHIIPVREGFERGISPEEMSKKENLRMLPWKENLTRHKKVK